MNYKRLIQNRDLRLKLLSFLDWIPDKLMLRIQYWIQTGRCLNLKNPQRFTEKLQWYKLNYHDPIMPQCVDKYEVREYVKKLGLGHLLNECYGIYERFEDIDFTQLPNLFVMKDTLGGGGNGILIVKDKKTLNLNKVKTITDSWIKINGKNAGREWVYETTHRIIIEKYIEPENPEEGLRDYKFFCFSGEPYVCQVISNRFSDEHIDFYDIKWNRLVGLVGLNINVTNSSFCFPKPKNFDEMVKVAGVLSTDFPFVRVDLYNVDGKVYFGELTFYPASGYGRFVPDSFDYESGAYFKLPVH